MSSDKPIWDRYKDHEYVGSPTHAGNLIGFLQSYAEKRGISIYDVYVEAIHQYNTTVIIVHTGWKE